jgi:3',5'-cyclic AMP phosphodiesterase CpdA
MLQNLRNKGYKFRYYTIPGNHDFYTNGGPFYDSLKSNNVSEGDIQKFGFFCLRNKSHTWQFIGLDTGYSGSSFYG